MGLFYGDGTAYGARVRKLSAEPVGVRTLYDIELESEDHLFIANDLVVHNCHRASSTSWEDIALASSAVVRLGMSGTPLKNQELSDLKLMGVTGPVIYDIAATTLVKQGLSAEPKIVMVMHENATGPWDAESALTEAEGELEGKENVKVFGPVYEAGYVNNDAHNRAVVRAVAWLVDHKRQTLVLCRRKEHFQKLDKLLTEAGILHASIWGASGRSDRNIAKDALSDKRIPVILATTILDEGVDIPNIGALVLAEGLKIRTNVLQRIGRGMRRKSGDNDLYVLDLVPTVHKMLTKHALVRAEIYESEGYETRIVTEWPPEGGDDANLLPFQTWDS
jgi:superfamily II DNA or RNA helicase